MRVAILAHSTNPRGGVVHALELAEALTRQGVEAVVHAPDVSGRGFFRRVACGAVGVPARPVTGGLVDLVSTRIEDYLAYFEAPGRRRFDAWHAQDAMSGNALSTLVEAGVIGGFVRTVHHVDRFADPRLAAWQDRSIAAARALLVVSQVWRDWVAEALGREAVVVGNGVDTTRYCPNPDAAERGSAPSWLHAPSSWPDASSSWPVASSARPGSSSSWPGLTRPSQPDLCGPDSPRTGLGGMAGSSPAMTTVRPAMTMMGPAMTMVRPAMASTEPPYFLAVGGVEARKNTLRILEAFRLVRASRPDVRLVIAGGASLLDHGAYQAAFGAALAGSGLPQDAVIRTGPVPDTEMPALYRGAAALVFPSVQEGFGLVVLEAMACGVPVVVSRIAPFTEYLSEHEALWCDPADAGSISLAMLASLDAGDALRDAGLAVAARHDWARVARRHLSVYAAMGETALA